MGIGTLRRHHDPEAAPEGVASTVDGEKTAETQNSPAKAPKGASAGARTKAAKQPPSEGR